MKKPATPKSATAKTAGAISQPATAQKNGSAPKTTPRAKALGTTNGNGASKPVTDSASPSRREEIARLAYKIWQDQGCPDGHEEQHWRQAEQAVAREGPDAFTA